MQSASRVVPVSVDAEYALCEWQDPSAHASFKRPRSDSGSDNVAPRDEPIRDAAPDDQAKVASGTSEKSKVNKEEPERLSYWIPQDYERGEYWTHEPYRSPKGEPIAVHYCKTRVDSERIAKQFLKCAAVGFDMEWAPFGAKGIKGNISLIQVACEDQIALFHIALHDGRTVSDLLAPSLRRLIENESILKCGVAINNADGSRLRKWMSLQPKGLFELSYLHRLVKWAKRDPSKAVKKLVKLTHLASEHLGKPLFKGDVRTSNWTKPLTEEQIRYAAADAYAGFRIFHALETKRLKLAAPIPPRPSPAELGLPLLLGVDEVESAQARQHEDSSAHEGEVLALLNESLARKPTAESVTADRVVSNVPTFKTPPIEYLAFDDPTTRRAFSALCALRKRLGTELKRPEQSLAADSTLFSLAEKRPQDNHALAQNTAWVQWAEAVSAHGGVDIFAFLHRHTAEDVQSVPASKARVRTKKVKRRAKARSQSSSDDDQDYFESVSIDDAKTARRSPGPPNETSNEYYFSEDDFDDSDLDMDDMIATKSISDTNNPQKNSPGDDVNDSQHLKYFSESDFDDTDFEVDDMDDQLDKLHTSFTT